jgi:hypothetical protein
MGMPWLKKVENKYGSEKNCETLQTLNTAPGTGSISYPSTVLNF